MSDLIGNLDSASLAEVLRICSVRQKTGTLTICQGMVEKKFYFDQGKLIYIASNKSGELVGEYLVERGDLTPTWSKFLLKDSQRSGVGFTSALLEKNIIPKEKLKSVLSSLANAALADAMGWTSGDFSFSSTIPQKALDGPIRISEVAALEQILSQDTGSESAPTTKGNAAAEVLRELARNIAANNVSLPLLPNIAIKLQQQWNNSGNADAILSMVRNDQVLSAHLLRVVNAVVGDSQHQCATVSQALETATPEHLLGIVHTQIACALPPTQPESVAKLLRQALRCASMAQHVAKQIGEDEDIAFTCGLFCNIGKVVMLQMPTNNSLTPDDKNRLIAQFHHNCGALLSRRWNLDPRIHDCIKYQSDPGTATDNNLLIETVYFSARVLRHGNAAATILDNCPHLRQKRLIIDELVQAVPVIDTIVNTVYK